MTAFFKQMYAKVRVVLWTALIAAAAAGLDVLAGYDWTQDLGPWAAPIAVGVAWVAAWFRRETTGGK